jgi:hypothetical protein
VIKLPKGTKKGQRIDKIGGNFDLGCSFAPPPFEFKTVRTAILVDEG